MLGAVFQLARSISQIDKNIKPNKPKALRVTRRDLVYSVHDSMLLEEINFIS